ncbi:MAG: alpha/beta hydrolase [Desulfobacterium sp.]
MKKPILKKIHITLMIISLILIGHITGSSIITADENTPLLRVETDNKTGEGKYDTNIEYRSGAMANMTAFKDASAAKGNMIYTADTKIWDVIDDPSFKEYGRLIFPAHMTINKSRTLREVDSILPWYNYVNLDSTVKIANYMKTRAEAGEQIFYDIYTNKEKSDDSAKKNTGLFFFRGKRGAKFAIVNAGGGFIYVGAMHDSFPHALELSKKGYNAFALIYRPGARTACEDLARAIAYIHKHAHELGVDKTDYSLWGGSAGARMAAWLGSYGTAAFGEVQYPRPGAVIMQYTGLSEVNVKEPPTYACVGTGDGIASYRVMESRIKRIKANGTDAQIEIFNELPHGFGLGEGTVANGWTDRAVQFWEKQMK